MPGLAVSRWQWWIVAGDAKFMLAAPVMILPMRAFATSGRLASTPPGTQERSTPAKGQHLDEEGGIRSKTSA